mmetsp:Transcript_42622/g.84731  ORF Transcript_42622/g.84731 Transcript_42622/m.84731 type:complete len:269 (+) Transcript_42622:86-892(+)
MKRLARPAQVQPPLTKRNWSTLHASLGAHRIPAVSELCGPHSRHNPSGLNGHPKTDELRKDAINRSLPDICRGPAKLRRHGTAGDELSVAEGCAGPRPVVTAKSALATQRDRKRPSGRQEDKHKSARRRNGNSLPCRLTVASKLEPHASLFWIGVRSDSGEVFERRATPDASGRWVEVRRTLPIAHAPQRSARHRRAADATCPMIARAVDAKVLRAIDGRCAGTRGEPPSVPRRVSAVLGLREEGRPAAELGVTIGDVSAALEVVIAA